MIEYRIRRIVGKDSRRRKRWRSYPPQLPATGLISTAQKHEAFHGPGPLPGHYASRHRQTMPQAPRAAGLMFPSTWISKRCAVTRDLSFPKAKYLVQLQEHSFRVPLIRPLCRNGYSTARFWIFENILMLIALPRSASFRFSVALQWP
jgi:hypothetical protein